MNDPASPRCDVLVISPHTDDAEIGLGGTMALLCEQGKKVWCLDLTRGELGTNDTGDTRWEEAAAASELLGLTGRVQLALPDGFIRAEDRSQAEAIVHVLRCLAPRWVFTAPDAVRHPDHVTAPLLTAKACFLARLAALQPELPELRTWDGGEKLPVPVERWEIEALFGVCAEQEPASLLFDVSSQWERKVAALRCYASQFLPGQGKRPTMINDASFLDRVERRALMWGHRAGCRHAEALRTAAVPVVRDLPEEPWRGWGWNR
jgi:bacillithiol biosynthesis deacetylase BshB1